MPAWRASSSSASLRRAPREVPLPAHFTTVRGLIDGEVSINRNVNVIGVVRDLQLPILTRDWKSTWTIYDKSTEDDTAGLRFNIFRADKDHIPIPDAGDVVVISQAKLQSWRGELSLITNWGTDVHVYSAALIPKPPQPASGAMQTPVLTTGRPASNQEHEYVAWLYHAIDKAMVPDVVEFQIQAERSLNARDKFRLLKDVVEGQFCDILVQVVRDPYDQMDKVTLWVTDFTANDKFFNFAWDGKGMPGGRDGDPYGYTAQQNKVSASWPGPFGRLCMQISCFEPHAEFVRSEVKARDWVSIRNLQIKFGRNANNLEGFLRYDREASASKIQVEIVDITNRDDADERLKEAIRRKRDYEHKAKKQMKSLAAEQKQAGVGSKRKMEQHEPVRVNAKQRRKERRAAAQKKAEEHEVKEAEVLGLNDLVKCESLDQPAVPLSTIIEPVVWTTHIGDGEAHLTLPFTNTKYRANVRVVDYRPRKLEDFATWRKQNEYDLLSDAGESSDSDSSNDEGTLDHFMGEKIWEWQFALKLQDATVKPGGTNKDDSVWVVVDNSDAQLLTNLDASDLRANESDLALLREQLFKLWGNLEEIKTKELQREVQAVKRLAAHQPPPDSSDIEQSDVRQNEQHQSPDRISNKPFSCCIRQYGVQMREADPEKADAGEGKRWQRVFGLFGTKICS